MTELAGTSDPPEMRGADTMIRRVTQEAAELEHLVEPEQVVTDRPVRRRALVLGGVALVLVLAFLVDPRQTWVLVQRFWAPQSDISLTRVTSVTGDATVPRGEPFAIAAKLENRKRESATLLLEREEGHTESISLAAVTEDEVDFNHRFPAADHPFQYRIRSGDGETPWHKITVADRPRLEEIELRITPPEYSKLPEQMETGLPGRVRALQGSRLDVAFRADQPVDRFYLRLGDEEERPLRPDDRGWYRYRAELDETLKFSPILVGELGLRNLRPPVCRIDVYRDRPPSVKIFSPNDTIAVRPDDAITIEFEANDDYGITKAELVVYDEPVVGADVVKEGDPAREFKVIEIPLGDGQDEKSVRGQIELDLKPLELKHGAELSYAVRVFDSKDTSAAAHPVRDSQQSTAAAQQNAISDAQTSDAQQPDGQRQNVDDQNRDDADLTAQNQSAVEPREIELPAESQSGSNSSAQRNVASAGNPSKPKPAGKLEGAPKPADEMTRRQLDVAGQCSACSPKHIIIDEWAGSYEGQAREKLQLAIDPYLKELDKELASAEELTGRVIQRTAPLADAQTQSPWNDEQTGSVKDAGRHLARGLQIIDRLEGTTAGTPYAFIGLQLVDIGQTHVLPADDDLRSIGKLPDPERQEPLGRAHHHIQRARELLARLTRQYEAVKQNHKLAEQMVRIKKMHQLFIEGTFKLLGSKKPLLNPKERAFLELELTEEFLAKLRELLEKKRDIQAELAKALAEDPRLLARFMARTRLEATTLRDQLTLLAGRQQKLHLEVSRWRDASDDELAELATEDLKSRQNHEAVDIAAAAAELYDNYVTWTPLDLDSTAGKLGGVREETARIASTAGKFAIGAGGDDDASTRQHANDLYARLQSFQETLPEAAIEDHSKLAVHIANRLLETRRLITLTSGWLRKDQNIADGEFHLAEEVDQNRLTTDTAELTRKIENLESWLSSLPDEIGELAGELLVKLNDEVIVEQIASEQTLRRNSLGMTAVHQQKAVASLAESEALMDEMMDKIIAHLDSLPASGRRPDLDKVQLATLEELLAMLENEARACEGLGIPCCRPTNLIIENDWLASGQGGSGGQGQSGMGRGSAMSAAAAAMQQSLSAQQRAQLMQQRASEEARRLSQYDSVRQRAAASFRERVRWNTLASQLADELRQGRGNLPPAEYRRAIERYFETISDIPARDE